VFGRGHDLPHLLAPILNDIRDAGTQCIGEFWEWAVGEGPCVVLSSTSDDEQVGRGVKELMNKSRQGAPNPSRFEAVQRELREVVGADRWSPFQKHAKACNVEESGNLLQLTPLRPLGRGRTTMKGVNLHVAVDSAPEQIGSLLRQALSLSETRYSVPKKTRHTHFSG
jgi:hypothetical protein